MDRTASLIDLERALHQPEVRRDAARVDQLLHPDYREFRRSGQVYGKADQLVKLPDETPVHIWADNFVVQPLGSQHALVTYRAGHLSPNGERTRPSLRSSLWVDTPTGWQMLFHQGTALPDETLQK